MNPGRTHFFGDDCLPARHFQKGDRVYVMAQATGSGTIDAIWENGMVLIVFDADDVVAPYRLDEVRPLPEPRPE